MNKAERKGNLPEIVIPKGYRLDEMLDFEGDKKKEKPDLQTTPDFVLRRLPCAGTCALFLL